MTQAALPFLFMRGGTSRGPYFERRHLPKDQDRLAKILIAALGSGHPLNIDGIGGGDAVTTKVAMLSPSDDAWADIDYFFAQVSVDKPLVDFKPTCGNILSGVGPAALEMQLMPIESPVTEVKIRAVNTGARISAHVQTPDGQVRYDGDAQIDGVPGTAAPITLHFMDVAGASTGAFLPTGHAIDVINGIEVTCMDVAMPMVIARAVDFGLTGHESAQALDENHVFFDAIEAIRLQAGEKMHLGDCSNSVIPKFGLIAESDQPNHMVVRYFMPWKTHPSLAVTGSQCLASCALTPHTVAHSMMTPLTSQTIPTKITLHHPMGQMEIITDYEIKEGQFIHKSAGLVRTARKLASGFLYVPASLSPYPDTWPGRH